MLSGRREFLKAAANVSLPPLVPAAVTKQGREYRAGKKYDVVVAGAGVFGSWTAHHLAASGKRVLLIDAYGASNARASSGGESRIIRMGYGADEIYTRSSQRSLDLWKEFFQKSGHPLFHETGVLWLAAAGDERIAKTSDVLKRAGVPFEKLARPELEKRFPQLSYSAGAWGIFEPHSGAILARRAVQAVAAAAFESGVDFLPEAIIPPPEHGRMASIATLGGHTIVAGEFVFACGPWLAKLFPLALGERIFSTRQEVFFFGVPPGDRRYAPPAMPCWIDAGEVYGIPDLENRGLKIASDRHGPPFDPDQGDRVVSQAQVETMRERLGRLFPGLKGAPLVESRVCQYENTANGDFLIDRHPDIENAWLVGGGSGHGFKHGPAVGEYAAARVLGTGKAEPRFSFASKGTVQNRSVF